MKRLTILSLIVAAVIGISYLPTASAGAPAATVVKTQTVARAAANELRAGQRLTAPRFAKRVLHYQWLRCGRFGARCAKIVGATHRSYVVRSRDVGHTLRVRVVLQGHTIAVSAPTELVGLPLPVNTAVPTITDGGQGGGNVGAPTTVVVGDVLTGTAGTWTNAVAFTYQWEDCNSSGASCTPITNATALTYTVASSDVGDTIVLQVTGYNYQP